MQIWNYSHTTGELVGSSVADAHPIEKGAWILPAFATAIEPPAPQAGLAQVFAGSSWSSVPDHRGETWWPTKQPFNDAPGVVIDFIGDPAAKDLTKTEPPAPPEVPAPPVVATPHQLFTALATAMGIAPDKIDALAELAKTL